MRPRLPGSAPRSLGVLKREARRTVAPPRAQRQTPPPPRARAPDEVLRADARRLDGGADEARAGDEDAPRRAQHREADGEARADEGPRIRRDAVEQLAPPEEHLLRHLALRHNAARAHGGAHQASVSARAPTRGLPARPGGPTARSSQRGGRSAQAAARRDRPPGPSTRSARALTVVVAVAISPEFFGAAEGAGPARVTRVLKTPGRTSRCEREGASKPGLRLAQGQACRRCPT